MVVQLGLKHKLESENDLYIQSMQKLGEVPVAPLQAYKQIYREISKIKRRIFFIWIIGEHKQSPLNVV